MDATSVERAAAALSNDEVVAVPTDTVYGLAVRLSPPAIDRLFALKGRSPDKPFVVLVGSRQQAAELATLSDAGRRLVDRLWPGPLTIVASRADGVDIDLGGDRTTIGLRFPRSELIGALTERVGPLVTTSANLSGEPPIASFAELCATFGHAIGAALDGGVLDAAPSTVVDCTGDAVIILRGGPVAADDLRAIAAGLA